MADAVESALNDPAGEDRAIKLGAWTEMVRRARIGRERKLAALVFGSYAENDGTKIHCGTARFALDCEVSYATARRYLAWMRQVGLVEKVRVGNKRKGLSDEYRLILGDDLLEHIDLPNPAQYKKMRDEISTANREGSARRSRRVREGRIGEEGDADLRSAMASADRIDSDGPRSALTQMSADELAETDLRSSTASAEIGDLRSSGTRSALIQDEHPPTSNTSPLNLTSPLKKVDLRTDVAVTRTRGPEDQIFPSTNKDPKPADQPVSVTTRPRPRQRTTRLGCGSYGCAGGAVVTSDNRLDYCPRCYDLDSDATDPKE